MSQTPGLRLELDQAIEALTSGAGHDRLRSAAHRLSTGYRHDGEGRPPAPRRERPDPLAPLAYAATRMPATLASAHAVLGELRRRCPTLDVESLLDIGAGPATTVWAAASEFQELSHATLIERDPGMVAVGRRLLECATLAERVRTTWLATLPRDPPSYDLVVMAYLLTELAPDERGAMVEAAWNACRGAVVVIVPGSMAGFRGMLDARRQLVTCGARIVAPCPHADTCPLPDDDWCHFGARLNRSSLHRRLKGGTLPYEDEKYSYVIGTRDLGDAVPGRVISRPRKRDRQVLLRVCGTDGLRVETITRSRGVTYRQARKLAWGDGWG